jgi:hypothetical protein
MIRSLVILALLVLGGLFGYFYLSDGSDRSQADRAKAAAGRVGDVVADQSIAGVVKLRLMSAYGGDARFLHVFHDAGRVTVYGLLPPRIAPDAVQSVLRDIPGLTDVRVLTQELPPDASGATPSGHP